MYIHLESIVYLVLRSSTYIIHEQPTDAQQKPPAVLSLLLDNLPVTYEPPCRVRPAVPSLWKKLSLPSPTGDRSRFNTGRWMKEEHEAFLRGVELYKKDWHLVAAVVKTRSVLQIRTHGQKYFAKLAKGEVFPLEVRI